MMSHIGSIAAAGLFLFALGSSAAAKDEVTKSSLIAENYPAESLAKGEQGLVHFTVELDDNARIDSCVVTKSSGYPRLDAATCDLIVKHAAFPAATSDGKRIATIRTGEISWTLPEPYRQNAKLAPPPVSVTAEQLEKQRLICKRSSTTGSAVRFTTYCLTPSEWAVAQYHAQAQTARMANPTGQHHGCHLRAGFGC